MSVIMCSKCDKVVDTDFKDYDFDNDLCEECSIEREEE
jgi:hypothetical protein